MKISKKKRLEARKAPFMPSEVTSSGILVGLRAEVLLPITPNGKS